ncbi:hypothetical protein [Saccharothrix texasensis]|uniref:Uncharacterized protein n=1 Tax=Saccharothrix texasensis TaxID=103734 RepID=A0A3N1H6X0_9PSEU|nr:hypothetical protein [Saccharothrix texasensis]ROP38249.1 hypothetical protein EDD40_3597 [Saccharothrix texasensis]
MDDETHRKKSSAVLKISLVVLGVLVLLGVIQAVTAGTVGVGALSVTLRETPSPSASASSSATSASTSDETVGSLDGAVGTTSQVDVPPGADASAKVLTGSWKQARGLLTVEVTKVENAGGRVKVFVTAVNASNAKMDLPVASVTAADDAQREYGASASASRWPVSIAKNSSINGYLELDQRVGADSTAFSLTFAGIIGQLAPTGGAVTVTGIPIPE